VKVVVSLLLVKVVINKQRQKLVMMYMTITEILLHGLVVVVEVGKPLVPVPAPPVVTVVPPLPVEAVLLLYQMDIQM
jgi:hypothetical protein